jgi:hypothetical protein
MPFCDRSDTEIRKVLKSMKKTLNSRVPARVGKQSVALKTQFAEISAMILDARKKAFRKVDAVLESPDGERTRHDRPICFGARRFMPRTMTVRFTSGGGES